MKILSCLTVLLIALMILGAAASANDLDVTGTYYVNKDEMYDNIFVRNGGVLYINAKLTASKDMTIYSGGVVTHNAQNSSFRLSVGSNLTIEPGGRINASGKGYLGTATTGYGPGGGINGGGGGYGGYGGFSTGNNGKPYGSISEPLELGSGAGGSGGISGGDGGGLVILNIANTLQIEGAIDASGTDYKANWQAGGGSGGSIYITASEIKGSGSIQANGGRGYKSYSSTTGSGGSGSGGRIALYPQSYGFTGKVIARSGTTGYVGGAGTVYIKEKDNKPRLTISNDGYTAGAFTEIPAGDYDLQELKIVDGAKAVNNGVIRIPQFIVEQGTTYYENGQTIDSQNSVVVYGILEIWNKDITKDDITIKSGGIITHRANADSHIYHLSLNANNLVIEAGGSINVSGRGYAGTSGTGYGPGGGYDGGGGGYGGYGGASTGNYGKPYGSITEPMELGSGAGGVGGISGGDGGGLVILNIANTLQIEGSIDASGTDYTANWQAGGGSGGSIYITASEIKGSGNIQANGGRGYKVYSSPPSSGGSGSGGRIALYPQSYGFTGKLIARSGTTGYVGGAGTVYIKEKDNKPRLTISNEGYTAGAFTEIPAGDYDLQELSITDGAKAVNNGVIRIPEFTVNPGVTYYENGQTLDPENNVIVYGTFEVWNKDVTKNDIIIKPGGKITHRANADSHIYHLSLNANNLVIEAGGSINVSGRGYAGTSGTGYGPGGGYNGGGGGYGGYGGLSSGSYGQQYGSITEPVDLGSGGGGEVTAYGGDGGGMVILKISNMLRIDGAIDASGTNH